MVDWTWSTFWKTVNIQKRRYRDERLWKNAKRPWIKRSRIGGWGLWDLEKIFRNFQNRSVDPNFLKKYYHGWRRSRGLMGTTRKRISSNQWKTTISPWPITSSMSEVNRRRGNVHYLFWQRRRCSGRIPGTNIVD